MHPIPRSFEWTICDVPVLGATCAMTGLFGVPRFSNLYHMFYQRLLVCYTFIKPLKYTVYLVRNYLILVMHPVPRSFEWAIDIVPVLQVHLPGKHALQSSAY